MEGHDFSLRDILPPKPLEWLAARARIYLFVLGGVVAGFFFVAGWLAESGDERGWSNAIWVIGGVALWLLVMSAHRTGLPGQADKAGDRKEGLF
ncbi:MAG: hypothetical protein JO326_00820 [Acetobacteraceae bacterium]|nr:hypothetical protein [Acetobacteraceae bacterium]